MSKFLATMLLHKQQSQVELWANQFEVDTYVARRRRSILSEQFKTVLRKPAVLAAIFGAGAAKEVVQSKKQDSEQCASSGTSFTQLAMFATRFM